MGDAIDIESLYTRELVSIWNIYPQPDFAGHGYAIEQILYQDTVLFIGMNPSYNRDTDKKNIYFNKYDHPYFSVSIEMARSLGVRYAHHDLLFVRHTNQMEVKKAFGNREYKEFFASQLDLSKRIIEQSKPSVIVVINAEASRVFKDIFKMTSQQINPDTGAYYVNLNGIDVPVLFSGMLTGQRALDLGSRERLEWHIGVLLKNHHKTI